MWRTLVFIEGVDRPQTYWFKSEKEAKKFAEKTYKEHGMKVRCAVDFVKKALVYSPEEVASL